MNIENLRKLIKGLGYTQLAKDLNEKNISKVATMALNLTKNNIYRTNIETGVRTKNVKAEELYNKLKAFLVGEGYTQAADFDKVICVDFDNTLTNYVEYKGLDVFDEPLPGAAEGVKKLREMGYKVILFTCRPETPALHAYLDKHGFTFDGVNSTEFNPPNTSDKPSAEWYIDDKNIAFDKNKGGWGAVLKQIAKADFNSIITNNKDKDNTFFTYNKITDELWFKKLKEAKEYFSTEFDLENDDTAKDGRKVIKFKEVSEKPFPEEYHFACCLNLAGGDWENPCAYFQCQLIKGSMNLKYSPPEPNCYKEPWFVIIPPATAGNNWLIQRKGTNKNEGKIIWSPLTREDKIPKALEKSIEIDYKKLWNYAEDYLKTLVNNYEQIKELAAKIYNESEGKLGYEEADEQAVKEFIQNTTKSSINYVITAEHDNACLMIDVPDEIKAWVKEIQNKIPKEQLGPEGLEKETHITLLYGVDDTEESIRVIQNHFKESMRIRNDINISYFDNPDASVAKLEIHTTDLRWMHSVLKSTLNNKHQYFYSPHITIAYLKPGERLPEDWKAPEIKWACDEILLSHRDDSQEIISVDNETPKSIFASFIKATKKEISDLLFECMLLKVSITELQAKNLIELVKNFANTNKLSDADIKRLALKEKESGGKAVSHYLDTVNTGRDTVQIFKNPDNGEIDECCGESHNCRGLIMSGDLYTWTLNLGEYLPNTPVEHGDIIAKMGWSSKLVVPIVIECNKKVVDFSSWYYLGHKLDKKLPVEEALYLIQTNKHLKSLGYKFGRSR